MSGRKLSPSESRAWARVTRSVRPMHDVPEMIDIESALPARPVRKPVQTGAKRQAGAAASHMVRKAALETQESRARRVRRGKVQIDARFDLHGLTQASAERHLQAFVQGQSLRGARCLLVITGKGRDGEGVLRRNFLHWLSTPAASTLVSNWAPAHPRHGGGGAFYLFLRRQA